MDEEYLTWLDPGWSISDTTTPSELRAMDGWLADDGYSCALELHAHRFSSACLDSMAIPRSRTQEFFWSAVTRVPPTGRWFVHPELHLHAGEPEFQLRIQPATADEEIGHLRVSTTGDKRIRPAVKGADLDYLTSALQEAAGSGADETVLLSAAGDIVEGTSTSILWWRDDVLCGPPSNGRLLPGITREVLFHLASVEGLATYVELATPQDLDGLETWAVNALYGIRPVVGWTDRPVRPGPADRATEWNRRLARQAVHVSDQRFTRPAVASAPKTR